MLFCVASFCFALPGFALLCFALLCFAMLWYAMLCFALLCVALLCDASRECGPGKPSSGTGDTALGTRAPGRKIEKPNCLTSLCVDFGLFDFTLFRSGET